MSQPAKTLALPVLTAMVAGSMLASGVFTLPRSFAQATGPLGLLIVWLIAGTGTYMLARVFQTLAQRRPDLDAGIFAYAQAGFGTYVGFLCAASYWAGACLLNVTYFVLIKGTLGAAVPAFGDGNTPQAIIASSVLLWAIHFLILRGLKKAAIINAIVTTAKVATIAGAIVVLALGFSTDVFTAGLWGGGMFGWADVPGQVQAALIIAVYVFLGIEGASVYSRFARHREDVGKATLWGLAAVSVLFFLITLLPYGILPRDELAALRNPSLGGVLAAVIGPFGAWFVSVGLILALIGAFLARSLLTAEVLSAAGKAGLVPPVFAREDAKGLPTAALWLSSALVQALLLLSLLAEEAYGSALKLTSAMIVIPYLFVALFALQSIASDARRERRHTYLATIYAVLMLWAAGPTLLWATTLILAPATFLYVAACSERDGPLFSTLEATICGGLTLASLAAWTALASGNLTF